MAEIVGLSLGAVSLTVQLFDGALRALETITSTLEDENVGNRGIDKERRKKQLSTSLRWLVPSLLPQFEAINSLLSEDSDDRLIRFRDSYVSDCSMTAVAGAIMTQVALTSLTLPALSQTHWFARASFVVSLISGALSVYFAVISQKLVGGLSLPGDVRAWLAIPLQRKLLPRLRDLEESLKTAEELRKFYPARKNHDKNDDNITELANLEDTVAEKFKSLIPRETSTAAALVLVIPSVTLGLSLGTYLLALGIYVGFVWSRNLDPLAAQHDSRNIFIFYMVATVPMLLFFAIPLGIKESESKRQKLSDSIQRHIDRLPKPASATGKTATSMKSENEQQDTPAPGPSFKRLSVALAEVIRTQEAALRSNRDLAAEITRHG